MTALSGFPRPRRVLDRDVLLPLLSDYVAFSPSVPGAPTSYLPVSPEFLITEVDFVFKKDFDILLIDAPPMFARESDLFPGFDVIGLGWPVYTAPKARAEDWIRDNYNAIDGMTLGNPARLSSGIMVVMLNLTRPRVGMYTLSSRSHFSYVEVNEITGVSDRMEDLGVLVLAAGTGWGSRAGYLGFLYRVPFIQWVDDGSPEVHYFQLFYGFAEVNADGTRAHVNTDGALKPTDTFTVGDYETPAIVYDRFRAVRNIF